MTWWHGGALFDSSDEVSRTGLIVNQMVYKSLTREDLFKVFVCQASNTNRTLPVSRKVKVVLNRKLATLSECNTMSGPPKIVYILPLSLKYGYCKRITTTHTSRPF